MSARTTYFRGCPGSKLSASSFHQEALSLISLNGRISRPTFDQLATFTYFLNGSTWMTGNPALQPAFREAARLEANFVQRSFKLTFTRSFGNDKLRASRERITGDEEEKGRVHGEWYKIVIENELVICIIRHWAVFLFVPSNHYIFALCE